METTTPVKIRILNAEPENFSQEARQILQSLGELVEEPVSQESLAARVHGFDALLVRLGLRVTREILESSVRLKVVVSAATGLDHIDLEAAREKNIAILSLQGEQEFLRTVPATAEHAWALLLALTRRIAWAFDDVRQGGWDRDRFRGHDLNGKRLGILGMGRIGEQVARYGIAFGMKVGAYDPYRKEWMNDIRRFETVEEMLRWSEILSVHLPLNAKTRGFLHEKRLRLLSRGAWILNTSRGAIVDEIALINLLEQGHLAGAAVDVLAVEQPAKGRQRSPLLQYAREHDNLLITPHLGGATVEATLRTEVFMAEKLRRFLADHCVGADSHGKY